MDWVAFDSHWQAREGILLAVAQARRLNREASIAAFFILMLFAIGSELCKHERQSGLLLASHEYYALAMKFFPTIVQLHNLVNVQGESHMLLSAEGSSTTRAGFLILAMFSLRNSRGPSVWYLSGVAIRLYVGHLPNA